MSLTSFLKSVSSLAASVDAADARSFAGIEWEDARVGVASQRVLIDAREKWGVRVVASESVPAEKVVRVREGASVYHAEVVASRPLSTGFELELAFLDAGKRREEREDTGGQARLETSGAMGDAAVRVEVLNVSVGGLQLLSDRPFNSGDTTRIVGDGVERVCRVCYCLKIPEGYRVGLQFCDEVHA